ncbi:MAG: tyrosine-type recombinase/integrase [Methanothrix sp.]|nr:tyrosine-type recombinase/integrase [Methanothrix sp.]MDD3710602.1 tyrosine-type recombinase/integrase [Methanothrix sp.]MDD5767614.1 tyrosine-type recombinase/integrase [Methanothrix sp.]MDI9398326.1 tyrosine-type recombinase/integrase [Euryarchaeota archaeon]
MVPKLISPAEFNALVDSLEGRDRLIIKLLAGTGLRISELTRLKKSDLDLDDKHRESKSIASLPRRACPSSPAR